MAGVGGELVGDLDLSMSNVRLLRTVTRDPPHKEERQ
jgi:hypothetical protein